MTTVTNRTPSLLSAYDLPRARTAAVDDTVLALSKQDNASKAAWDKFIDECLVEWGRNPAALEDEDFLPPARSVIGLACRLAYEWRDWGFQAPNRVVPDGDGGLAFERFDGPIFETFRFHPDGTVELLSFKDRKLQERISIRP